MSRADSISSVISGLRLPLLDADGQPMLDAAGRPNVRSCSMVESINIPLMWRVCHLAYGLSNYDIWSPSPMPSTPATHVSGGPLPVASGNS